MRTIVVLLFVTIIVFYVCIFSGLCVPQIDKFKIDHLMSFDEVMNNLTTGSLIFLSGDTYGERVCKLIDQSIFSHVGLVFVEDGVHYVFECDVGQGYKSGVRVIPLWDKLTRYKGCKIGAIRVLHCDDHNNHISINPQKYLDLEFDSWMFSWMNRLFKKKNNRYKSSYF